MKAHAGPGDEKLQQTLSVKTPKDFFCFKSVDYFSLLSP